MNLTKAIIIGLFFGLLQVSFSPFYGIYDIPTILFSCIVVGIISYYYFRSFKLGAVFGIFYTVPPVKLRYRGFGEFLAAFLIGPLVTFGSYLVFTGNVDYITLLLGLPNGLITSLILIQLAQKRREIDLTYGKRTIATYLSQKSLMILRHVLHVLIYITIVILFYILKLHPCVFTVFMLIPLTYLSLVKDLVKSWSIPFLTRVLMTLVLIVSMLI